MIFFHHISSLYLYIMTSIYSNVIETLLLNTSTPYETPRNFADKERSPLSSTSLRESIPQLNNDLSLTRVAQLIKVMITLCYRHCTCADYRNRKGVRR